MLPMGSIIAVRAARDLARSALPGAPTVPDPPPRQRRAAKRARTRAATFLRASAHRRARLAERLDPACSTSLS